MAAILHEQGALYAGGVLTVLGAISSLFGLFRRLPPSQRQTCTSFGVVSLGFGAVCAYYGTFYDEGSRGYWLIVLIGGAITWVVFTAAVVKRGLDRQPLRAEEHDVDHDGGAADHDAEEGDVEPVQGEVTQHATEGGTRTGARAVVAAGASPPSARWLCASLIVGGITGAAAAAVRRGLR